MKSNPACRDQQNESSCNRTLNYWSVAFKASQCRQNSSNKKENNLRLIIHWRKSHMQERRQTSQQDETALIFIRYIKRNCPCRTITLQQYYLKSQSEFLTLHFKTTLKFGKLVTSFKKYILLI